MLLLLSSLLLAEGIEQKADVQLGVSYERIGMAVQGWYGARLPMFEKEGNVLFQNTGLTAQLGAQVTPAFVRYGGRATFSPLAILDISAFGMHSHYVDGFQNLVDFDTADFDYGKDEDIQQYIQDTGRRSAGSGWHGGGNITLKIKVSSVIVLANAGIEYWDIAGESQQGEWLWEPQNQVLMRSNGDLYQNGALLCMNEWVFNEEKEQLLRSGLIGTYRHSSESTDTMVQAGIITIFQHNAHFSHTLLTNVYLVDRAFPTWSPTLAYAFTWRP